MDRYLVIHRQKDGRYSVYSYYDKLDEIETDLYESFRETRLGEEYIVIDTDSLGNGVIGTYTAERRIVCRKVGALETAWSDKDKPNAYSVDIGDGAKILRFV